MHVPYFRVSLILAILWFIAGIASVWSPGISSYFVINIIRILSSGIALALCFHAVSRNRDEVLYKILTFAIACIFLNDIYSFAHYLVVGAFLGQNHVKNEAKNHVFIHNNRPVYGCYNRNTDCLFYQRAAETVEKGK